jgi:hypothetical protein
LRVEFYAVLDRSWVVVDTGSGREGMRAGPSEMFADLGRVSHLMAAKVREWVDRLYPFAGLGAARVDTTINRVWRDLHTAGQHPLLVFQISCALRPSALL